MTEEIATTEIKQVREPSCELTDDELDQVNGGVVVTAIIAVLIGMLPAPTELTYKSPPPQ